MSSVWLFLISVCVFFVRFSALSCFKDVTEFTEQSFNEKETHDNQRTITIDSMVVKCDEESHFNSELSSETHGVISSSETHGVVAYSGCGGSKNDFEMLSDGEKFVQIFSRMDSITTKLIDLATKSSDLKSSLDDFETRMASVDARIAALEVVMDKNIADVGRVAILLRDVVDEPLYESATTSGDREFDSEDGVICSSEAGSN
jgi:hypothetical protein